MFEVTHGTHSPPLIHRLYRPYIELGSKIGHESLESNSMLFRCNEGSQQAMGALYSSLGVVIPDIVGKCLIYTQAIII